MFLNETGFENNFIVKEDLKKNSIYVTKPSLPELDEFIPYLEQIWESRILTNDGDFHKMLEAELANFLGVKYLSLFSI